MTTFAKTLDYLQPFSKGCQMIRGAEILEELWYFHVGCRKCTLKWAISAFLLNTNLTQYVPHYVEI